ncbi:unnamed protein product [Malus baccata var. baccata]
MVGSPPADAWPAFLKPTLPSLFLFFPALSLSCFLVASSSDLEIAILRFYRTHSVNSQMGHELVTSNDLHPLQLLDLPLNLCLRHHQFSGVASPRKSGFVSDAVTGAVGDDPSGDPI